MKRTWTTLVAVSVATFMLLLDVTVVTVALPQIQRDLGASFTELQWTIDAYALTLAATLLIFGSLADRVARRRVFAGGVAAFSLASLACGLAWDPVSLDVLRGIQGLGGAAMLAASLALIAAAYSGRERTSGLRLLPLTIAAFFAAAVAARLGERVPVRLLIAFGLALAGVGMLLNRQVEAGSDWTALLAGSIVIGVGVGAAWSPRSSRSPAPPSRSPSCGPTTSSPVARPVRWRTPRLRSSPEIDPAWHSTSPTRRRSAMDRFDCRVPVRLLVTRGEVG